MVHLAYSKAMLSTGSTTYVDPLLGQETVGLRGPNLEAGFHLFWGTFQQISGSSWLTIFRYFPSIVLMMTVLSVFILARRQGFGWEAALFTCLIPTIIGILDGEISPMKAYAKKQIKLKASLTDLIKMRKFF